MALLCPKNLPLACVTYICRISLRCLFSSCVIARAADMLHSSGGVVLTPEGDFGIHANQVAQLNRIAQWQLKML